MEPNPLDRIRHQIVAGDCQGATLALAELLEAEPDSAEAWALLALLLTEPAEQAQCYREILRINPDDRQAEIWLESLTAQVAAAQATSQPPTQDLRNRECPRCGEMIRVSPAQGSLTGAFTCPHCGFPVRPADTPSEEAAIQGNEPVDDKAVSDIEWIPDGIDLEQLLGELPLPGNETLAPTHEPGMGQRPSERKGFLDRLLSRFRRGTTETEAEGLVMGQVRTAAAAGALAPNLILQLAGGPLAPEERRDCPQCKAVVSRSDERCPWCSASLPDVQD